MKEVIVTHQCQIYIYCSPLLPVLSLDAVLATGNSPVHLYTDTADPADIALIKRFHANRLRAWVRELPADLAVIAGGILCGETQASLARLLGLSEVAISKRVARLARKGRVQLADLRRSPLLT
jgi:hypothetical protein